MADLTTKYLGLTLSNPIIVASSGLTDSVEKIRNLELNGAGAVVLKSLFEEQILREADFKMRKAQENGLMYAEHSETFDYIDMHVKEKTVNDYTDLIKEAKKAVHIPVIASVNCITANEWTGFAKNIEKAGADALELNIFIMPFSLEKDCRDIDKVYYEIIEKIKREISIPVAVKLSPFFSNLGFLIKTLDQKGVDGVVLFNRFSRPDIDIEKIRLVPASIYSTPEEMYSTLRWIGILGNRVHCDLAASTGVHDGEAVIKQLLAGAHAVQIASAIYKNGPEYILKMKTTLDHWMDRKGFRYIDQFRGRLSQEKTENPEVFERLQFMKYFSKIV